MKKYLLLYKILLLCLPGFAQLTVSDGVNWISNGNVTITIQNMNWVNNGHFVPGTGSIKFTGNQNSGISGNSAPRINILEIAKTTGAKVSLNRAIVINSSISFISGQLDLNGSNILMTASANISGESENNRIIGPNGGFVEITQNMNAPASANPGNLGATITSSVNLGDVTIRRGHTAQSGTGLPTSTNRYYFITPQNNSNLNATLRLRYFDAELNGQNENLLVIYQSNNNGLDWSNTSQNSRNNNSNYVETTGVNSLALQTLANDIITGAVTNLVFEATRKKPTEVKLNWTTQAETNMSGYEIQRRLNNETDFSARSFVNSNAPGGNSSVQLAYNYLDLNSYTDKSYYRLKIVDANGSFSYSEVKAVPGKTKGGGGGNGNNRETVNAAGSSGVPGVSAKIIAGPNPNNGNFWFMVNGIEKEAVATLYTIDGKVLKQFRVLNQQQQKVNGLGNGMYLLKVAGIETFKIMVQGSSTPSSNNTVDQSATKY